MTSPGSRGSGSPDESPRGTAGTSLALIAAGIAVFVVCEIVQRAGNTSMFSPTYEVSSDFSNFLLELAVVGSFWLGWIVSVASVGSGILGLLGRDTKPGPDGNSPASAQSPTTAVSPGRWVEDPFGRHQHRYWNGRRWTDRVSDNGLVGTDPAVATKISSVAPVSPAVPGSPAPAGLPVPATSAPELSPRRPVISPGAGVVLRFADGRVVPVAGTVVVGRSPSLPEAYPGAGLVTVADLTVSKSHAAVGVRGSGVWVCDLDSSNGVIVLAGGVERTVVAGTEFALSPGDRVSLGDETAFVVDVGLPDQTMPRSSFGEPRPGTVGPP